MAENFSFNAPQFVDFANGLTEEDIKNVEAYFGKCFFAVSTGRCVYVFSGIKEVDHEQFLKGENGLAGEVEIATDQDFTPPEQQGKWLALFNVIKSEHTMFLCPEAKHHLRRSMSAGNILPTSNANNSENDELK